MANESTSGEEKEERGRHYQNHRHESYSVKSFQQKYYRKYATIIENSRDEPGQSHETLNSEGRDKPRMNLRIVKANRPASTVAIEEMTVNGSR